MNVLLVCFIPMNVLLEDSFVNGHDRKRKAGIYISTGNYKC